MARRKAVRHEPPILLMDAIKRYNLPRWWFNYYGPLMDSVNREALNLSKRYAYVFPDEVERVKRQRPYIPRNKAMHTIAA